MYILKAFLYPWVIINFILNRKRKVENKNYGKMKNQTNIIRFKLNQLLNGYSLQTEINNMKLILCPWLTTSSVLEFILSLPCIANFSLTAKWWSPTCHQHLTEMLLQTSDLSETKWTQAFFFLLLSFSYYQTLRNQLQDFFLKRKNYSHKNVMPQD